MIIQPPLYDKLKWLAQVVLPALGALYVGLAALWDLPKPQEVAGTILAVDTFLGVVLGISSSNFKNDDSRFDGTLEINPAGDGTGTVDLQLADKHPDDLAKKDEVVFKVASPPLATASRHRTGKRHPRK